MKPFANGFDLNPLTSFIIEVYSTEFDLVKFRNAVERISNVVESDDTYKSYYQTACPKCGCKTAILQNFKWELGEIYECGIVCPNCNELKSILLNLLKFNLKFPKPIAFLFIVT